jgi:Family of unknown function (DUF6146)
MKNLVFFGLVILTLWACSNSKSIAKEPTAVLQTKTSDTLRISNNELQYEIIIIDPGFNNWFVTNARPRDFYTQTFLEARNNIYVSEWNRRFLQPNNNQNIYDMRIDYNFGTDYGFEVNYLLYNYFIYFQIKNKQQFSGFAPRP